MNGAGLMHWGERAKAGEVHIYRMTCKSMAVKDNGIYEIHLMWLAGRRLHGWNEKPAAEPERLTPLTSRQQPTAVHRALELFLQKQARLNPRSGSSQSGSFLSWSAAYSLNTAQASLAVTPSPQRNIAMPRL